MTPSPPPRPTPIPPAEVAITTELVRDLLAAQHADLSMRPLSPAAEGFDNVMFRCGDDLAVRIPRRALGAECLERELTWLPVVAPRLPIATPAPIRVGAPAAGFPWRWAVVPWFAGEEATTADPEPAEAARLAGTLAILHGLDMPPDPPANPYRDRPLAERTELTYRRLDIAASVVPGLDRRRLAAIFDEGAAAPIDVPASLIHGDLHPRNVIVSEGVVAAIIDWGDICAGDPATDLAALWMLFPPECHAAAWEVYQPTESTRARARGWAVALGAVLVEAGAAGDRALGRVGARTLTRLLG